MTRRPNRRILDDLQPKGYKLISSLELTAPTRPVGIKKMKTMKTALILIAACTLSMGAIAKGGSHSRSEHSGSEHSGGSHSRSEHSGSEHSTGEQVNSSSHTLKGHTSHATNPNNTKTDNYSNKGNVNPQTGQAGAKD